MFCALNGATRMPLRANSRHRPATSTDLPASELVPATSNAPFTWANAAQTTVRISARVSVTSNVCSNCAVHLRSLVTTVQPSSQIS